MRTDLSWFEIQLLAYREAARSVMACELGREPPVTTIEADDESVFSDERLELPHFANRSSADARAAACRDCLYLLAGYAISIHIYRREWSQQSGAETSWRRELLHDETRRARALVRSLCLTEDAAADSMDHLGKLALSTLAQPRVFRRVRRVADALLKRGTVQAAEVRSIVSASDRERDDEPPPPVRIMSRRVISARSPVLRPVYDSPMWQWREKRRTWIPKRSAGQAYDLGIASLHLSGRALGALRRGSITTLEELLRRSPADLLNIRSTGSAIVDEIVAAVERAGFALETSTVATTDSDARRNTQQLDEERGGDATRCYNKTC